MFTVNVKGRRDPKNIELVKLDLIFTNADMPAFQKCSASQVSTGSGIEKASRSPERTRPKRTSCSDWKNSDI